MTNLPIQFDLHFHPSASPLFHRSSGLFPSISLNFPSCNSILIHPFLVSKPVFITSHVSYTHFHDVNVQFSDSEICRHKHEGSLDNMVQLFPNVLYWQMCWTVGIHVSLGDQNAAIVITPFQRSQFQDLNVVSVWTQLKSYLILKIILLFSELQIWFLMANCKFKPWRVPVEPQGPFGNIVTWRRL